MSGSDVVSGRVLCRLRQGVYKGCKCGVPHTGLPESIRLVDRQRGGGFEIGIRKAGQGAAERVSSDGDCVPRVLSHVARQRRGQGRRYGLVGIVETRMNLTSSTCVVDGEEGEVGEEVLERVSSGEGGDDLLGVVRAEDGDSGRGGGVGDDL